MEAWEAALLARSSPALDRALAAVERHGLAAGGKPVDPGAPVDRPRTLGYWTAHDAAVHESGASGVHPRPCAARQACGDARGHTRFPVRKIVT